MQEYKNNKGNQILETILMLFFFAQLGIIVFFDFTEIITHMTFDSSWVYLKSMLIWEEGSFFSPAWEETTSLFWDTPMPLAVLFYGITKNIWFSYGMADFIILLCILWVISRIMKKINIGRKGRLLTYNLLCCPYLSNGYGTNDLGYFHNLITGFAQYSVRILVCLLITDIFLELVYSKKLKPSLYVYMFITISLCCLLGVSSGVFVVVIILFPYVIYILEKVFIENSYRQLIRKEAVFSYLCIIFCFIGKIFGEKVLHFFSEDSGKTWSSVEKIWDNLGAVIQGFMSLIGVFPKTNTSLNVMSFEGICRIFPLYVFLVCIFVTVFATYVIIKNKFDKSTTGIMFLVNVILVNIVMFSLFNVAYGDPIFEERYLILSFIFMIILVGYFFEKMDMRLIISNVLYYVLILSICSLSLISDSKYIENRHTTWKNTEYSEVVDLLDLNCPDCEVVYINGYNLCTLGRNLRVLDFERIYKVYLGYFYHWGDYMYYDNNDEYQGPTCLINEKGIDINYDFFGKYQLVCETEDLQIYRCETNPIDINSGITSECSYEYPYSLGVVTENGEYIDGRYISNGMEGFIMYGPYAQTIPGEYEFSLFYSAKGERDILGIFDVAINSGQALATVDLTAADNVVTVNVCFDSADDLFEYRVYGYEGSCIEIDHVEIKKIR